MLAELPNDESDKNTPKSDGGWDGDKGESGWVSFHPDVVRLTGGEPIQYVNHDPVLQPYALKTVDPVILGGMTGHNDIDFKEARTELMRREPDRWNSLNHVEQWEKGLKPDNDGGRLSYTDSEGKERPEPYTWHHEPDRETMILVPTMLHGNLPHTGGASPARSGIGPDREPPFSTSPL
jgi:hypothetical protein